MTSSDMPLFIKGETITLMAAKSMSSVWIWDLELISVSREVT